jgi:hypothetical protein
MRSAIRCILAVLSLAVTVGTGSAEAQAPGDSIRLSRYEGAPIAGKFVARADGRWTLVSNGDTVSVQDETLWRRELRQRRDGGAVRAQRRSGAVLVGAVVAGGMVFAATDGLARMLVFPAAAVGAIYGGLLGTVATTGVGDWYWQEIP